MLKKFAVRWEVYSCLNLPSKEEVYTIPLLEAFGKALPDYLQWVIDDAIQNRNLHLVTALGVGFLLLLAIQGGLSAARSIATISLASNVKFQWLGNAFGHLMRLPMAYFEQRHLGDIVSRFSSIQVIQRTLTTQFVESLLDGLLALVTFGVMLFYSQSLALISFASVAIYAAARRAILTPLLSASGEQIICAAKQETHFVESVRGVQSILLFGKSQQRRIGWTNLLASQFNSETTIATLTALHQTVNLVLFNAERIIVVWIAAKKIVGGDFTVGMLFAFLSFKEQFTQRVSSLIDKIAEMRMLRTHGDRVADVVFSEPEEVAISDIIEDRTLIAGSLELQNICFRYSMNDPYVFENINLSILEGESVAITGPSGGGKTTLVKVMLGLLRPSSGQILLGGIDIRTLGLSRFRAVIGTVMQDDHLFAGTIGDNISFFDPEPDLARIESSAKKASIFAEITAMPMGFRSVVGDLGSGLSGGQQQRILLARALYKQPQILVLDEATSHLDVQNELSVNGSLADLALTKIVVAHRKETIQMCDRVVYLLDGGLKEVSFNARTA